MEKLIIVFNEFLDYLYKYFFTYVPSHRFRRFIFKYKLSSLGRNTFFLMGVEIRNGENISIGSNCAVNNGVLLDGRGGKIVIGDNVDIAQETNFWTLQHDVNSDNHNTIGSDIVIEDYVWIASRVTILPGVKIRKGAVIGAGSIVTSEVKSMDIVAGNPAKKIGVRKSSLNYKLFYKPRFK